MQISRLKQPLEIDLGCLNLANPEHYDQIKVTNSSFFSISPSASVLALV